MNKQKGYPIAHSTPLLKLFSDIFQNKYNMFYNFVTGENFNCCLKNTFLWPRDLIMRPCKNDLGDVVGVIWETLHTTWKFLAWPL